MTDDDELKRLEEANAVLDALPPELVKAAILEGGYQETALDTLRDIALNSDDPVAKADALQYIRNAGLELILLPDEDRPAP